MLGMLKVDTQHFQDDHAANRIRGVVRYWKGVTDNMLLERTA
jgi:hypothetical protein